MKPSAKLFFSTFWNAFLPQNIVLVQAMGLCPILAIGYTLPYGVALSACTTAVLVPVGLIFDWWGAAISPKLRPVLYVLSSSVLLLGAALILRQCISPEIYASLYLFLPLMAVNTLFTYRAAGTGFGRRNPLLSLADSLGSALGFSLVLCVTAALREMAINGTLWGIALGYEIRFPEAKNPFIGYVLLGFMAAALQWMKQLFRPRAEKKGAIEP